MGRRSGAQALPPAGRLRRAAEMQSVFERGNRVESRGFVLLWRPGTGGRKAGFAVSRRVGGAVQRNRVRRRLREAYRRSTPFPPDLLLVFVGRTAAGSAPFPDLIAEMERAAARVGSRAGSPGALAPSR